MSPALTGQPGSMEWVDAQRPADIRRLLHLDRIAAHTKQHLDRCAPSARPGIGADFYELALTAADRLASQQADAILATGHRLVAAHSLARNSAPGDRGPFDTALVAAWCKVPLADGDSGERLHEDTLGALLEEHVAALQRPDPVTEVERRREGEEAVARKGQRYLHLTRASTIAIRPVRWLWAGRLALGTLGLIAGREGVGKSNFAYWAVAMVTTGRLPGCYEGQPRAVIIVATEDSWAHTIVPRLMAAGADLDLVYRVEVITSEGADGSLSLPKDNAELEQAVADTGAALILLDPLLSRLDSGLDSHKDAEVRLALEPIVAIADRANAAIFGLIHLNKSTTSDPLTMIMGSRAFAAVARSVLMFARDPDDEDTILVGLEKNNLGRLDLPTLKMRIVGALAGIDADGNRVETSRATWHGETDTKIRDAIAEAVAGAGDRSATADAADWLGDYMQTVGGSDDSATIKKAGRAAGHSESALKRARGKLSIFADSRGFPRRTWWNLPAAAANYLSPNPVGSGLGESELTGLTGPTGLTGGPVGPVGPVGSVGPDPARAGPTVCPSCGAPRNARRVERGQGCTACEWKP